MKQFVVDACVGIKWYFKETFSENSYHLLNDKNKLYAPDLFILEINNILCKRIRRKDITPEDAEVIRASLPKLAIEYHNPAKLLDSAFQIASTTGSSFYDCIYLALAVSLECRMITSDKRLVKNISNSPFSSHILWIEDID